MSNNNISYNSNFKNATKRLISAYEIGLEKACIAVEGTAAKLSPVDTGRLRGSITYSLNNGNKSEIRGEAKSGDGITSVPDNKMEGYVGSNVNYAIYVEYLQNSFLRKATLLIKNKIAKFFGNEGMKESNKGGK